MKRFWVALVVAMTWMVGMDVLDRINSGNWLYFYVLDNAIGGLTFGVLSWVALEQWEQKQKIMRERYELILAMAHQIANPVQILINREHLPTEQREKVVEEAINELVRVCKDVIPKLGL